VANSVGYGKTPLLMNLLFQSFNSEQAGSTCKWRVVDSVRFVVTLIKLELRHVASNDRIISKGVVCNDLSMHANLY
jgi:hypothetical protein